MIDLYWSESSNENSIPSIPEGIKKITILFSQEPDKIFNLLKNLSLIFDSNNYLQPYGCYQDMIGTLKLTNKYRGRLIIAKKLSPILMEWKKNDFIDENLPVFKNATFSDSIFYFIDMKPQEIQDIYYENEVETSRNSFWTSFKAAAYIDNDYTFVDIYYISDEYTEQIKAL